MHIPALLFLVENPNGKSSKELPQGKSFRKCTQGRMLKEVPWRRWMAIPNQIWVFGGWMWSGRLPVLGGWCSGYSLHLISHQIVLFFGWWVAIFHFCFGRRLDGWYYGHIALDVLWFVSGTPIVALKRSWKVAAAPSLHTIMSLVRRWPSIIHNLPLLFLVENPQGQSWRTLPKGTSSGKPLRNQVKDMPLGEILKGIH